MVHKGPPCVCVGEGARPHGMASSLTIQLLLSPLSGRGTEREREREKERDCERYMKEVTQKLTLIIYYGCVHFFALMAWAVHIWTCGFFPTSFYISFFFSFFLLFFFLSFLRDFISSLAFVQRVVSYTITTRLAHLK